MAWIESHQELARHPKTKKLSRLMGVSLPAAVGHLHFFWWWAMDYAQDGNLTKYDQEEIADACGWEGEPQILIDALAESGFIDRMESDVVIHDWHDYAGRLIEKREQNKERKKRSRARHAPVTEPSQEKAEDDRESHRATQPNQTIPNHTKPLKHKTAFEAYTSNPDLLESLNSFLEMRKRIKKPMTDRAIALLLGKLTKMGKDDNHKISLLEQSILNCWQDIYELKGGATGAVNGGHPENPYAGVDFGF